MLKEVAPQEEGRMPKPEPKAVIEVTFATATVNVVTDGRKLFKVPCSFNSDDTSLYEMLVRITLSLLTCDAVTKTDYVLWWITDATPPVQPMMMRVEEVAAEHEQTLVSATKVQRVATARLEQAALQTRTKKEKE